MKEPLRRILLPPYGQTKRVGISKAPAAALASCPGSVPAANIGSDVRQRVEGTRAYSNAEILEIALVGYIQRSITPSTESTRDFAMLADRKDHAPLHDQRKKGRAR